MKNVIKPLAKSFSIPLGLTTAGAANAGTNRKVLGSGTTLLIISKDEMKDIIKIVKYLEYTDLLMEGVSETIQNKAKEQKGGFLSMLLGTLGESLRGNILAAKGINRVGKGIVRSGYGNNRQDYENKMDF